MDHREGREGPQRAIEEMGVPREVEGPQVSASSGDGSEPPVLVELGRGMSRVRQVQVPEGESLEVGRGMGEGGEAFGAEFGALREVEDSERGGALGEVDDGVWGDAREASQAHVSQMRGVLGELIQGQIGHRAPGEVHSSEGGERHGGGGHEGVLRGKGGWGWGWVRVGLDLQIIGGGKNVEGGDARREWRECAP